MSLVRPYWYVREGTVLDIPEVYGSSTTCTAFLLGAVNASDI
jgi:hypothetical protein